MRPGRPIVVLVLGCASVVFASEGVFDPQDRAHWAFQKVSRPATPQVRNGDWVRGPVDAFIVAGLEKNNIPPSPPAGKRTLIRRAYLDLIGIPPTPAEVNGFLNDDSPRAFERVVDRLLASPQYGERWARHWLDLARYAESEGFKADETRPNAWRYRDYVIRSLNNDKPYDRFVQEQIAGDELWPEDRDAHVATAFNRHYADESNARNLMQRRQEILNDITDTVGFVFAGMSYACARCHDHKFEPILQTDYYRLQAFFANTAAKDDLVLISDAELDSYRERLALWQERTRGIREQMEAIEAPKRKALEHDYFEKYPAEIRAIIAKAESERNPFERQMAWKARQYLNPESHEYVGGMEAVLARLKGAEKEKWESLKAELDTFAHLHPGDLPLGSGMVDLGEEAPKTFLLAKGVFDQQRDEVQPGFLQLLNPAPAKIAGGRRSTLARILTDPGNPLTARVMANRIWHYHFGKGIVGTPSEFGLKGDRPTHPQLLDWLASEFVRNGWSMKHLHRVIMNSAAYQQSSLHREDAARYDPENKLLWKFPMHRLEGEAIRDASLAVAGALNPRMGGQSIFPELPPGMPTPRGGWKVNDDPSERNRRSVYIFVRRNTRYPLFESFDMPDPHESCSRRAVTTSPIQALNLLNSKLTLEWAQSFAARVIALAGADLAKQIDAAFEFAYCRPPLADEKKVAFQFLSAHREVIGDDSANGSRTLADLCHMLLNSNEFVYRN